NDEAFPRQRESKERNPELRAYWGTVLSDPSERTEYALGRSPGNVEGTSQPFRVKAFALTLIAPSRLAAVPRV
ncbi:MAG: hypothetical protein ACPHL6_08560, partial [Rubripirellula sp.]